MISEEFMEQLADEAMVLADLDAAIIGFDIEDRVPVYSYDGLLEGLSMNNPDWSRQDALDWYDYNIGGMLVGGQFRVVHMELYQ